MADLRQLHLLQPDPLPPLSEVVGEIKRELRMREGAYRRFVERGSMTEQEAVRQYLRLKAALTYLEQVPDRDDLFGRGAAC